MSKKNLFGILCVILALLLLCSSLVIFANNNLSLSCFQCNKGLEVASRQNCQQTNSKPSKIEEVYLGGYPLGISIDGEGVTVIGLNEFVAEDGKLISPAQKCGVEINDVILQLDGRKIYSSNKVMEIVAYSQGKPLELVVLRDGKRVDLQIQPRKDLANGQFRLGLWTRDASSGVGTLTYVKKNLCFGSLGHPICTSQGQVVSCKNGGIYHCDISGIKRGEKGSAGELRGNLAFDNRLGNIYSNNKFGVFGTFNCLPHFCENTIAVANINEVHIGNAQIYCCLEGNQRKAYDVEIVKANFQSTADDKGLVLLVTDKELLEKTGGIVQGMSGSPIVQNGKLVGAVTHVFVNDPTRGYGIYAKWMLEN